MLPSVDSIRGFAHAAGFAAARRRLWFLVEKLNSINALGVGLIFDMYGTFIRHIAKNK